MTLEAPRQVLSVFEAYRGPRSLDPGGPHPPPAHHPLPPKAHHLTPVPIARYRTLVRNARRPHARAGPARRAPGPSQLECIRCPVTRSSGTRVPGRHPERHESARYAIERHERPVVVSGRWKVGFSLATNAATALRWSSVAPVSAIFSASKAERLVEGVGGGVGDRPADRAVRHGRPGGEPGGQLGAPSPASSSAGTTRVARPSSSASCGRDRCAGSRAAPSPWPGRPAGAASRRRRCRRTARRR